MSLRRVELLDMRLTGVDLAHAVLEDVTVRNCRLDPASLRFARVARCAATRAR